MTEPNATTLYRAARDCLLEGNPTEFAWPEFPGTFNWAVDWFDVMGRGNHRRALWIVEEDGREVRRSFDDLVRRSDQVATWLQTTGIRQGHRVLVMLDNQVELWESMLALMKLGAVILPATTALGSSDLAARVTRAGVHHVIAKAADAPKFDAVAGDYGRICVDGDLPGWVDYRAAATVEAQSPWPSTTLPADPLLLYFTSGTTSQPKLVEHTQTSYPVGHLTTMYWLGIKPGDMHLNISSPGWAKHAWSCLFAPWIAEATVFVFNYTRFDAAALLAQIRRAEVTTFCAPPTVWRMLIQADLSAGAGSLREVAAAGEPLNPEVISQVQKHWGLTLRDAFGQTETTAQIGNPPGQRVKPGSMGRPLPGVPVVLVDPLTGQLAEEGEICLDLAQRPLSLMTGYQGDAERNAVAMAGGYYHTGDIASRDDEGYITYVGRTDDVFKASDYKISPFELESVLLQHAAVAEAAVVPAPDPIRLAVPKAYVTLAAGWEPSRETALSVLAHARHALAPYLRVRRIEFVDALPKTVSGKIRRVDLRDAEQQRAVGALASVSTEWRDDQFPEIR